MYMKQTKNARSQTDIYTYTYTYVHHISNIYTTNINRGEKGEKCTLGEQIYAVRRGEDIKGETRYATCERMRVGMAIAAKRWTTQSPYWDSRLQPPCHVWLSRAPCAQGHCLEERAFARRTGPAPRLHHGDAMGSSSPPGFLKSLAAMAL